MKTPPAVDHFQAASRTAVPGLPAELVAGFHRIGLAGSELAAPADVPRPPVWARRL